MDYQHSELFARLKGTNETIAGNLTSYEYLKSLDTLIYNALFPLIDNTKYVDTFLAKVMAWQSTNPKRKGSGVGRHALVSFVTMFFLLDKTEAKIKILKKMKLDRGILLEMLRRWLELATQYEDISNKVPLTREDINEGYILEKLCKLRTGHSLYGAAVQSRYWYGLASDFKTMILEKYTRLCLMKAQQDYVELKHKVNLEDIIQVYLMTASKAVDKCDTDKGVLTTHVQNWLMSAKNTVMANYMEGVAYQIPSHVKDQVAKIGQGEGQTVSLDDIEDLAVEVQDEHRDDNINHIRLIAKIFDSTGYGRLMLGIEEFLSRDDLAKLRIHMVTTESAEPEPQL